MLVNLHPLLLNNNNKIKEAMNIKGNINNFLGSTRPFKTHKGEEGKDCSILSLDVSPWAGETALCWDKFCYFFFENQQSPLRSDFTDAYDNQEGSRHPKQPL